MKTKPGAVRPSQTLPIWLLQVTSARQAVPVRTVTGDTFIRSLAAICITAILWLTAAVTGHAAGQTPVQAPVAASSQSAAQREVNEIWSLLALAIAFKDWQSDTGRGHNIATLLIDPSGQPVFWARNDRFATDNGTDHSEVRLMRYFLDCPNRVQYLGEQSPEHYPGARTGRGFTLYTTLEPCVMCTGMMLMNRLTTAIYVQSDPDYGKVMERLDASTAAGWPPYPVHLEIAQVQMPEAEMLDSLYESLGRKDMIIPFLRTEMARQVFASADGRLREFQSQHGNQALLPIAVDYLDTRVDADYQPNPLKECPQAP